MPVALNQLRWVYWPPLIHLGICSLAMVGYAVPGLQFLGILWSVLTIADFPLSIVTVALAFSQHSIIAAIWVLVAGTLWWYLLCRTAEFLSKRMKTK